MSVSNLLGANNGFVLFNIVIILLSFIVLAKSAKEAIKRLVRISRHLGASEFVISFVILGTITVLPELSIGINSALQGVSSFGLGIIFGSNIADLTLIIGLTALAVKRLKIQKSTMHQTKWMLFGAILPIILILDGEISRLDGAVLIFAFLIYIIELIIKKPVKLKNIVKKEYVNLIEEIAMVVISFAVLLAAGKLITDSAQSLSSLLSIPLIFLGTILAIGTCLPELAFAIQAAKNKHSQLGFGNILGKVFVDCMATIGIIAVIQPIKPALLGLALTPGILMIIAMLTVFTIFRAKKELSRAHGIALVALYVIFMMLQTFIEKIFIS